MNTHMKWMGLVVATSALTACAAVPPSKPLTYGEPRDSVRHEVHQDFNTQVFVLSDGGSSYRFESIGFEDDGYINYWFVYRDNAFYAVIGRKEVLKGALYTDPEPPCSNSDQAAWLDLAQQNHAQDLKTYDFRDPEDYEKPSPPQSAGEVTGLVLLGVGTVALYVEYPVALVFPIALMTPGAVTDGKARAYADHPEFGVSQDVLRGKIGTPAGGSIPRDGCQVDRYGSTFYGAEWAEYWYLNGRLFAVTHGG